jgi:hypothetical protein
MDYCSSCRRHLNGALVCPGCGAYAPDIDPSAADGRHHPAPVAAHDGSPGDTAETGAYDASHAGPFGGQAAPQGGRAARRRQLARWKKNKRRAVMATAVAIVGGGLTISTMDRQSTDRAQAATAPEHSGKGGPEEQTPDLILPSSPRPDTHRSSRTPSDPSRATSPPRRQALPDTPTKASTDAAAPPRPAPKSTPPAQTTPESSGGTEPDRSDTAPETEEQTPAPPADNESGSNSGTSQTSPTPTPTSTPQSPELCLLVVCLGGG